MQYLKKRAWTGVCSLEWFPLPFNDIFLYYTQFLSKSFFTWKYFYLPHFSFQNLSPPNVLNLFSFYLSCRYQHLGFFFLFVLVQISKNCCYFLYWCIYPLIIVLFILSLRSLELFQMKFQALYDWNFLFFRWCWEFFLFGWKNHDIFAFLVGCFGWERVFQEFGSKLWLEGEGAGDEDFTGSCEGEGGLGFWSVSPLHKIMR